MVLDLYAGSGALGIEALSRGAEHCTFVERDRGRRAGDRREHRDARAAGPQRASSSATGSRRAPPIDADLAFADPPYGFDDWPRLLRAVRAPMLVAEAEAEIADDLAAAQGWERGRVKRYGRTWVTFLHRVDDVDGQP